MSDRSNLKLEVVKEKKWFLRLTNTLNGKTILVSETYFSKWNAKRAARKLAAINGFQYEDPA